MRAHSCGRPALRGEFVHRRHLRASGICTGDGGRRARHRGNDRVERWIDGTEEDDRGGCREIDTGHSTGSHALGSHKRRSEPQQLCVSGNENQFVLVPGVGHSDYLVTWFEGDDLHIGP